MRLTESSVRRAEEAGVDDVGQRERPVAHAIEPDDDAIALDPGDAAGSERRMHDRIVDAEGTVDDIGGRAGDDPCDAVVALPARRLELLAEGVEEIAAAAAVRLGVAAQQLDARSRVPPAPLLLLADIRCQGPGVQPAGRNDGAVWLEPDRVEHLENHDDLLGLSAAHARPPRELRRR